MRGAGIYRRRDERWEGRIYKGKNSHGKRCYIAIYGRTREQVEDKMRARMLQLDNHPIIKDVLFCEIVSAWFQSVRYRIKESTLANYHLKANKHILPAFGQKNVSCITSEDIRQFIQSKQEQMLSNRYILDILVLMKSFFKYAVSHYHIVNPMDDVEMPSKKVSNVRLLNNDEQAKLERFVVNHHSRTTLGIALAKFTGLRIGELCALQWKDVDLEKRIMTVSKTIQRIQVKNGDRKT